VRLETIELQEGAGIEEELDPFAGGELPGPVLALDSLTAPAESRAFIQLIELLGFLLD
jgi:hypothetical protein